MYCIHDTMTHTISSSIKPSELSFGKTSFYIDLIPIPLCTLAGDLLHCCCSYYVKLFAIECNTWTRQRWMMVRKGRRVEGGGVYKKKKTVIIWIHVCMNAKSKINVYKYWRYTIFDEFAFKLKTWYIYSIKWHKQVRTEKEHFGFHKQFYTILFMYGRFVYNTYICTRSWLCNILLCTLTMKT